MPENQPTTSIARREQAVREGTADDAVDTLDRGADPRGFRRKTPSRQRQQQVKQDIAEEIDIGRRGVGSVDRIGGLDVFLRSPGVDQFGENVAEDFAGQADYVEAEDVDPRVDQQDIQARPIVDPQRRPAVRERATESVAAEDQYAKPGDFRAEVGPRGVRSVGLTDMGARQRAGRQFEAETSLFDVDPTADIEPADGGFALGDTAQRRAATRGFEADYGLFDRGELDPSEDVRTVGDGFGLGKDEVREVAAARIDDQINQFDISPSDIDLEKTDAGGFRGIFEREVQR